jgi:peroxiredoxin
VALQRALVVPAALWMALGCGCSPRPIPNSAAEPRASEPDSPEPTRSSGPRPPDFELATLDGGSLRLSDHLGGKVVLIDFWATYCDPCIAAMPHLDELYRKHKADGFLVLAVSIDGPDSLAQVRTLVQKTRVTFPILLDVESTVVARYNPRTSAPFSVLIGRDGRVLKKQEGYTTGSARALEADIQSALAQR